MTPDNPEGSRDRYRYMSFQSLLIIYREGYYEYEYRNCETSSPVPPVPLCRATCPPAPPCKTTTTIWSPALRRYARRHTARAHHAIKGCGSRAETPMLLAGLGLLLLLMVPSLASSSQLREKREELNRSIAADEEEKGASSPSPHRRCAQSSCVLLL